MRNFRLFLAACFCLLALNGTGFAQATGIYAFGPYDSLGFDTINRGNLNIHFSIPILSKPGRGGSNFSYALTYDGLIWSPKSSSGASVWTPASAWGWGDVTNAEWGYVTYSEALVDCTLPPKGLQEMYATYSQYVYHDSRGAIHPIAFSFSDTCGNVGPPTGTATYTLTDNSGLTVYRNGNSFIVFTKQGAEFAVPSYVDFDGGYHEQTKPGAGVFTDTNGNQISASSSGVFTDTMGKTVLSISGSAPNPVIYAYTDSNGNPQKVTVNYTTQYSVKTAFGVSGITEYTSSGTVPLVSSITFSGDGTSYSFGYENTPNNSGYVTGRINSITLRTGGTINYTYNGIESDGTTAGLTRATSDGTSSYVRSGISSTASTTTFADAANNQTVYTYLINPTGGYFYEGDRKTYQGSASGTPLLEVQTCYNNSSCSNSSVSSAFASIEEYEYQNGTLVWDRGQTFQGPELLATDVGSSTNSSTTYSYNQYTGPNNIAFYRLASVAAGALPSGTTYQETTFGYDETTPKGTSGLPQHIAVSTRRGNLTSIHEFLNSSGSSEINSTRTYDDAGQLLTLTDTNNDITTYGYDPGTDTLLTQITLPTVNGNALSASFNFDSNTGLLNSWTDMNSQSTSYKYDGLLRPTLIQYPDGGKTTYSYTSTQTSQHQYQNASTYADTETLLDGYGRTSRFAVANGQSTNPWYQTDTCYNSVGEIGFTSYSYQGNGFAQSKVCTGSGDSYSYDALGRTLQVTHGDNAHTHVTYSYNATATQVTDENGSSRIINMLSPTQIAGVCEISSSNLEGDSPASCSMPISGTGYLTNYFYDLANHKITVTQGVQTRTFQTDWVGRPILVQEPESGQTTFSYTGLTVTRTRPTANQTNASTLTTTTSQYDSLGRLVSISYSDGTPAKQYLYDTNGGFRAPQSNLKGRLSRATASTSPNFSGTVFSYDAVGRIIQLSECFPWTCGTPADDKNLNYTYDLAGDLISSTDGAGVTTSYAYTPASEVQGITSSLSNATHPGTLLSSVQNGAFGPISYTLGNGHSQFDSYDALGRPNAGYVCPTTPSNNCSGQIYGFTASWQGAQLKSSTDTVTGPITQYNYDGFNRLTSTVNGSSTLYTYTYDRWGNRWAQQGAFTFSQAFNKSNNQLTGYAYDAAGNLMSDGTNSYTYDADGNVIQGSSGGNITTMIYDALNHQVGQGFTSGSDIGSAVAFDKDGNLASLWLVSTGNSLGSSALIGKAYWNGTAFESYNGNTAFFEHRDWVGSRRAATNSAGTVTDVRTSLPFGDGASNVSGSRDNTFDGYTGLWDETAATNHAQFRDYWNVAGRWLQPDPYYGSYDLSNPQSMNRYSYVSNNPLAYIDPSGLDESIDPCSDPWYSESHAECGPSFPGGGYGGGYGGGSGGDGGGGGGGGTAAPDVWSQPYPYWGDDPGSFGESLGIPSNVQLGNFEIAQVLGLPTDPGCEFGVCGDGAVKQTPINEDKTLQQKIAELEQAGIYVGALETKFSPFHKGQITLRDRHWLCSQHVTLDQGSGNNGKPVTGESHYDLFNPWKLPLLTTLLHTEYDLIPDKLGDRFPWFPSPSNICSYF